MTDGRRRRREGHRSRAGQCRPARRSASGRRRPRSRRSRYITLEDLETPSRRGHAHGAQRRPRQGRRAEEGEGRVGAATSRATRALVNRVLAARSAASRTSSSSTTRRTTPIASSASDRSEEDDGETTTRTSEEFVSEATVWVDGLDRIHKLRGINFCVDLSATPYFLGRVGQETNRLFPWVVSDFGLTDAIESGLVKIPQLAVRDTTGAEIPGYFNIWRWILPKLTPGRAGRQASQPKARGDPEMGASCRSPCLAASGRRSARRGRRSGDEKRPPVFILVCKNTQIAKVDLRLAGGGQAADRHPAGAPVDELPQPRRQQATRSASTPRWSRRLTPARPRATSRAGCASRSTPSASADWPRDSQGRPIYPEGFEELAEKLGRPLHPPGRDVRCIVSVGMLTEGWDCNTVTHIVGLRPFMSQLLCEQVVGRGLRRASYDVRADGKLDEEVAKVFGVPFEVIPFKANTGRPRPPKPKRHHVHAMPEKEAFAIKFPRVEGYSRRSATGSAVDWATSRRSGSTAQEIPPEVDVKDLMPDGNAAGRRCRGRAGSKSVTLDAYRARPRVSGARLPFEPRDLTRRFRHEHGNGAPAHVLFPQIARDRRALHCAKRSSRDLPDPAHRRISLALLRVGDRTSARKRSEPDASEGEAPELPVLEKNRKAGSTADVDFLDKPRCARGHQEPRQSRGRRHGAMGAIGSLSDRQACGRRRIREECGARLRNPLSRQRRAARLRAGFHRSAE